MPLFAPKRIRNPIGPAIPDFTNQEKIREYVRNLSGDMMKVNAFQSKLGMIRKDVVRRYHRVSDELDFVKFYEQKKASGSFEPNYCIVKWDKNYTRHLVFWSRIHERYNDIMRDHASRNAGQGFYEYDESIKELRRWIDNITDPKLLTEIEACIIAGLDPIPL